MLSSVAAPLNPGDMYYFDAECNPVSRILSYQSSAWKKIPKINRVKYIIYMWGTAQGTQWNG